MWVFLLFDEGMFQGGSDLHKYIEFIEMSLGIAARRILAAYQPPRRFIRSVHPSASPSFSPQLSLSLSVARLRRLSRIY